MAGLIYKQRHAEGTKQAKASKNSAHIKYIGERIHAVKNENGNGLFGQLDGKFKTIFDMETAQNYVKKISLKGTTIFRGIISFEQDTPNKIGLENPEDWQKYLKYNMWTVAARNGIKIENLEYLAAVHLKDGQPHLHAAFWDKSARVEVQFVDPEIPDGIRRALIKKTFAPELEAYAELKDTALKTVSAKTDEALESVPKNLIDEYQNLLENLPKNGSLKYDFLPPEYKIQLNKFCENLRLACPQIAGAYDLFLESKRAQAEAFNSSESNYGRYQIASIMGKAKDEIDKKIANRTLRFLKQEITEQRKSQRVKNQEDFQQKIQARSVSNLANSLARFLGAADKASFAPDGSRDGRGGELTQNEKLEIARLYEDNSIDNER